MPTLTVKDFIGSNILDELRLNPSWEKWRRFGLFGCIVASLSCMYSALGFQVHCEPAFPNGTSMKEPIYTSPTAARVNAYCSNDDNVLLLRWCGWIMTVLNIETLIFTHHWLFRSSVINALRTFAKARDLIEEIKKKDLKSSFDKDEERKMSDAEELICSIDVKKSIRKIYLSRSIPLLIHLVLAYLGLISLSILSFFIRYSFICDGDLTMNYNHYICDQTFDREVFLLTFVTTIGIAVQISTVIISLKKTVVNLTRCKNNGILAVTTLLILISVAYFVSCIVLHSIDCKGIQKDVIRKTTIILGFVAMVVPFFLPPVILLVILLVKKCVCCCRMDAETCRRNNAMERRTNDNDKRKNAAYFLLTLYENAEPSNLEFFKKFVASVFDEHEDSNYIVGCVIQTLDEMNNKINNKETVACLFFAYHLINQFYDNHDNLIKISEKLVSTEIRSWDQSTLKFLETANRKANDGEGSEQHWKIVIALLDAFVVNEPNRRDCFIALPDEEDPKNKTKIERLVQAMLWKTPRGYIDQGPRYVIEISPSPIRQLICNELQKQGKSGDYSGSLIEYIGTFDKDFFPLTRSELLTECYV